MTGLPPKALGALIYGQVVLLVKTECPDLSIRSIRDALGRVYEEGDWGRKPVTMTTALDLAEATVWRIHDEAL